MLVKETCNFYTFGMCFLAFLTCGAHRGFVLNSASVVTVFVQEKSWGCNTHTHTHCLTHTHTHNFPGGPVVKNRPANAGDVGLIPGPRRAHQLQSSKAPWATTIEPVPWSP